jgi:hypothetical protein
MTLATSLQQQQPATTATTQQQRPLIGPGLVSHGRGASRLDSAEPTRSNRGIPATMAPRPLAHRVGARVNTRARLRFVPWDARPARPPPHMGSSEIQKAPSRGNRCMRGNDAATDACAVTVRQQMHARQRCGNRCMRGDRCMRANLPPPPPPILGQAGQHIHDPRRRADKRERHRRRPQ